MKVSVWTVQGQPSFGDGTSGPFRSCLLLLPLDAEGSQVMDAFINLASRADGVKYTHATVDEIVYVGWGHVPGA
jgi:hypothetical protein